MKNKYLTSITIAFCLSLISINFLNAQHFIEITDGPLAGTKMEISISNYKPYCELPIGVEQNAELCSPLEGANLGDPSGIADLNISNGSVGICRRGGGISFDSKAANVYASGGKAIIILNNDLVDLDNEIIFGAVSPDPSFWGISLSTNNGKIILESNVSTFKFKILAVEDNTIDEVIWEDGQFDGGIGTWSTVGISCGDPGQNVDLAVWKYDPMGAAFGGNAISATIASPTACNGAMVFNSEFYDSNGANPGDGPCWKKQVGELISPNIDLSALNPGDPVTLTFYQAVYQDMSEYFVSWSNDGGATWIEQEINETLISGQFIEGEKVRLRLGGAIPTTNFKVKFTYKGDSFFWIIDDVKLVKAETFLSVVDPDWMTSAPYPTVPLSQIEHVNFMTNVENISNMDLTGTVLSVKVLNGSGVEVYAVETPVTSPGEVSGKLLKGDKIENIVLGDYTPFNTGAYKVHYTVKSNENNATNLINTVEKTFTVTPALFGDWGREDGVTGNVSMEFAEGERVNWAYSNIFKPINQAAAYISFATCYVANGSEMGQIGASMQFYLYVGEDINPDNIYTSNEYEIKGYSNYDFQNEDKDDLYVGLSLNDINTGEAALIPIDSQKTYILSLVYEAPITSPTSKIYWSTGDKINQKASEYLGIANGSYMPTHEIHAPWTIDGPIDCTENRFMFEGSPVPAARLHLATISSTKNILNEYSLKVFPTNAIDNIKVQLNLTNSANGSIEIYNIKGEKLYTERFLNQNEFSRIIKVDRLSQGTYFVKVVTEAGSISKPFNVVNR